MEELLVIKIGGNIVDDEKTLDSFLNDFASIPGNKILVHGGGKLATELSERLGIATKMIDGRRVTDADTIRIVTMTYAGWINKNIVARLQSKNCNAMGLSGADGRIIPAVKRPVKDIDYGWVGDIEGERINVQLLSKLLDEEIAPIIAPVTCDDKGNLLNVNADTIARVLSEALSGVYKTMLIYCFEKNGLLRDVNDETSVVAEVDKGASDILKTQGVISKGMIPKIDNAFDAICKGVDTVMIGHAAQIKKMAQKEKGYGTNIKA